MIGALSPYVWGHIKEGGLEGGGEEVQRVGCGQGKKIAIEAIEDTSVPGNDVSGIFNSGTPFEHRLEQIAENPGSSYD